MAASELARQSRRPRADARDSYEKGKAADQLAAAADELADQVAGNEQMMEGLMHEINYLARSKHQSRYRNLCLTAMEQAHSWLLRENGEPEPVRKFEAVEEPAPPQPITKPKPINGKKK